MTCKSEPHDAAIAQNFAMKLGVQPRCMACMYGCGMQRGEQAVIMRRNERGLDASHAAACLGDADVQAARWGCQSDSRIMCAPMAILMRPSSL